MSLEVDEAYGDDSAYIRDDVKLVVETQDESLVITYANLDPKDTYELTILLVEKLGQMVGQEYNQVLEDLKEIEEERI